MNKLYRYTKYAYIGNVVYMSMQQQTNDTNTQNISGSQHMDFCNTHMTIQYA